MGARRGAASRYTRRLGAIGALHVPHEAPYTTHVYHQYTLRVEPGCRDRLRERLAAQGIPTAVYYPLSLTQQPAYARACASDGRLEVALRLPQCVLSLPMHTELTERQQERIVAAIERFFEE